MSENAGVMAYGQHTVALKELTGIAKIHGRTVVDASGIIFEWSASGFELSGELEGDVTAAINFVQGECSCFLRVQVDGQDTDRPLKLERGEKTYTLATGLRKGKHTIAVYKMTESFMNSITVSTVSFTGQLTPLTAAKRKMEIIGDSISAGLDIYVEGAPEGDIGEFEDGTRTYGALAAQMFGADYHVFACAGWGCIGGAGGDWATIPRIYDQASFQRLTNLKWDFNTWQPDVVVVNLGTNDGGFIWQNKLSDLDFEKSVRDFLAQLRSRNPEAHIVWAYGMMGNGMKNLLLNAIEDVQQTDSKVHFVELPRTTRSSDSHPGVEDHQKAAKVLAEAIENITGWKQK